VFHRPHFETTAEFEICCVISTLSGILWNLTKRRVIDVVACLRAFADRLSNVAEIVMAHISEASIVVDISFKSTSAASETGN